MAEKERVAVPEVTRDELSEICTRIGDNKAPGLDAGTRQFWGYFLQHRSSTSCYCCLRLVNFRGDSHRPICPYEQYVGMGNLQRIAQVVQSQVRLSDQ